MARTRYALAAAALAVASACASSDGAKAPFAAGRGDGSYALGSFVLEVVVAPALDEGATAVDVYLPAGAWVHVWSGRAYGSATVGGRVTVDAPLGRPPVFYRRGPAVGATVRRHPKPPFHRRLARAPFGRLPLRCRNLPLPCRPEGA